MDIKSNSQNSPNGEGAPSPKNTLRKEGVVIDAFPGTLFKVRLDEGGEALAHLSGKMRMNQIKVLSGDRVVVEFSPYDLTKGRIVYRSK